MPNHPTQHQPAPRDATDEYEVTITSTGYTALLVGGAPPTQRLVVGALDESFEVFRCDAAQPGVILAATRQAAPDLIVLDVGDAETDVLNLLAADPMTDFIPVLALSEPWEAPGEGLTREADGRLIRPFELETLRHVALSLVHGAHGGLPTHAADLAAATAPEVLGFVARELETSVLNALGSSAHAMRLGPGNDLVMMGVLARFIAELRGLFVAADDAAPAPAGAARTRVDVVSLPNVTAPDTVEEVGEDDVIGEAPAWVESLRGISAVVADDDATVRRTFSEALAALHVAVRTASDGAEALAAVRDDPPDVVITDIVMPRMDGWELLRRLRRDVLLWDVPAVVVSWREDFLLRMRELDAGASDYLLKEQDRTRILERVAAVVRGRRQVLRLVEAGGPFSCRLEPVGIVPLLRLVAAARATLRLTLRETWNLFRVEIAGGELVHVANATVGGIASAGPEALASLLGVKGGRLVVHPLEDRAAPTLGGPLLTQLRAAARGLQELLDQVSLGSVLDVRAVELRRDLLPDYLEVMPVELRDAVAHLAAGRSPRLLMLDGRVPPKSMETLIVDMIRRGLVTHLKTDRP
jgi:DNA-binding response OmpR family regulator